MPDTDRTATKSQTFSDAEKQAMQDRAKELKAEKRRAAGGKGDGLKDLQEKIAALDGQDRTMAERIHELIMAAAPGLEPRTYYGMPAWAKDGKVLCFFTPAAKFKERYATFGFNAEAKLDDGKMWPTSFAITSLTSKEEARLTSLVKQAVG